MHDTSISLPDEANNDARAQKAVSMNPFEMSDDEEADLSALNDTANENTENGFRERTTSRETCSFYDTIDDNDTKYYSTNSNM